MSEMGLTGEESPVAEKKNCDPKENLTGFHISVPWVRPQKSCS